MYAKKVVRSVAGFAGLVSVLALLNACSEAVVPNYLKQRSIRVTTDPPQCKIVLESMGNRQVLTYFAPADIAFAPRPGMPTKISISKEGYQTKNMRLDGSQDHIHVVLEKSIMQFEGFDGGTRGGGMGGSPGFGGMMDSGGDSNGGGNGGGLMGPPPTEGTPDASGSSPSIQPQ